MRWTRGVIVSLLLLSLWTGAAVALDRTGRREAPEGRWDAVIVAGCRVDPGGVPSLALQRRTRLGVDLWRRGLAPRVVFTGGVGDNPPSEASAAAAYAATLGLPAEATLLEERSTSTEENAAFAAELLSAQGIEARRVLLVTDSYHTLRAGRVFGRYFREVQPVGSLASRSVRARGAMREVLALSWYAATGRL